ncbi:MAG: IclR family transcriptional regulator [Sneathiella sp.]|jgi:IclR family acetate operon transcriptional repressor|uniref:IclR family transcriptional regulator n=1 Tax=Sneathiella sp. TaxID=1964365 RepID=UPI000C64FFC4|nr:IclR family transcriptional regulator C-terminal domain-containing protein [Sneathiella sp.]MAL78908.1 IclR family transcriptional regulator [Sneathiella sp.]|tara:strand:- start:217 stop:1017 length:801 start_codon:yes stop_codon:yes gene_type:complete
MKATARGEPVARSGQVQSLTRALSILNIIADAPPGLSLTAIAKSLSLPPSTAHRLLTTLQEERYVQYDRDSSRWQIAMRAFVTGNGFLVSRDLSTVARPYMRRLMELSGETVNLAIADGDKAIYLAQVESREMMRVFSKPGNSVPLHCSGVGKAILMAMPEKDVGRIIEMRGLAKLTDKTIVEPERLHHELAEAKERGFALDDEEHAIGLRCVAALIYDEHAEPLAGLSISGPAARISRERMIELGNITKMIADEVTAALGGRLPA